jgi:hypothetical protein
MKNKQIDKPRATVTIRGAAGMTDGERTSVAMWLCKQVHLLLRESHTLAQRYTARYFEPTPKVARKRRKTK